MQLLQSFIARRGSSYTPQSGNHTYFLTTIILPSV